MAKKHIGNIDIEAGKCWIGDPCYVLPDDASEREQVNTWDKFCETMRPNKKYASFNYRMGHEGLGVCVSTGYGDGSYPVHAVIKNGVIHSVEVTFIKDDDAVQEWGGNNDV